MAVSYVGIIISTMIFITDILACIPVARNSHEYAKEITRPSINLAIVYVTLILDTIFILPSFLCILYILWINITGCENRKMSTSGKPIRWFFKVLIGEKSFDEIEATANEEVVAYAFPIFFGTPLLCISSHIGYILLAWVTEPSKATANLILYYVIIVLVYLSFRRFYTLHEETYLKWWYTKQSIMQEKATETIELDDVSENDPKKAITSEVSTKQDHQIEKRVYCCLSVVKVKRDHVNPQAFCLLLFYAVFVLIFSFLIIFIFILLPISSENLITYLFNALELIVVFISTQVAFKLFFNSDFDLREAMKSFRDTFSKKGDVQNISVIAKDKTVGLESASGAIAAGLTGLVIHKNTQN